jgi:N-sulfoglucosamine sulfohydrolase
MNNINILYIDCHDLGDRLGCYGYGYAQSPHLDRLAAEGARLDGFFATAPQCMPSRTSLYTGRHPAELEVYGQTAPTRPVDWVASHFRRHGYRTQLLGGLNVLVTPDQAGFADCRACPNHDEAAIELFAGLSGAETPWFVHASFGLVHRPFGNDFDPTIAKTVSVPPYLPDTPEVRMDIATFYAKVETLDRQVGHLLNGLKAAGQADRTLVVFTTDHGPAMARMKHTLYDPGLKIAGLFRLPGEIPAGLTVNALLSGVDMVTTLCDLAGIEPPRGHQGSSFAAALHGLDTQGREAVFSAITWTRRNGMLSYHPARSIRTARYRLIRNFTPDPNYLDTDWLARFAWREAVIRDWPHFGIARPEVELYDVLDDPHSLRNRADSPELAEIRSTLAEQLQAHLKDTDDAVLSQPMPRMSNEPIKPQWALEGGHYRLVYRHLDETRERPFTGPLQESDR